MSDEKPNLLLVEDNEITRLSLNTMFERAGYEVHQAKTVDEAIEILKKLPGLAAVLTDYELAAGNGIVVIELARTQFPEAKLAVFTAHQELENNDKVNSFLNTRNLKGKVKFFYKPIESSAFFDWLRH